MRETLAAVDQQKLLIGPPKKKIITFPDDCLLFFCGMKLL